MTTENERLVFVYGTLQRGGRLNSSMTAGAGGTFLSSAKMTNNDFIMRDLGAYPALQKVDNQHGTTIHGELYSVPLSGIKVLDRVEGYPDLYSRTTVTVVTTTGSWSAIVYFMDGCNDIRQAPIVDSGEWNACLNCAVSVNSNAYDDYLVGDDCPACGYWLLDGKCNECAAANPCTDCSDLAETKAEVGTKDFTVQNGIYIISVYGEFFGPYDDIDDALHSIGTVAQMQGEDSKMFTVGFRVLRNDTTPEELSEIDAFTSKI